MKVLVAGATGAIGRPLVSTLIAARHEVIGMSNSDHGAQSLREKGVEGFVANALDENTVLTVIRRVRPDALIEELTSLPKQYTPEEMKAAADRDRTVRLVGGRNVQNAAHSRRETLRRAIHGIFLRAGPGLGDGERRLGGERFARSCGQRSNLYANRRGSARRPQHARRRFALRIFLRSGNIS